MKIVTLTLNPAFDMHCFAESFRPYHESHAHVTSRDAGGKGVNISRALCAVGRDNCAVVIVGRDNGDEFCRELEKDGVRLAPLWVDGRIRENITLHERANPETRISFDGFACPEDPLDDLRRCVGEVDADTLVTFTGSIPKGIAVARVLDLLGEWRDRGAHIVIDSRSVSLEDLLRFRPYLIKPNSDEAESYMNRPIATPDAAAEVALELYEGGVENVIISLGGDGAVLACRGGVFYAQAPHISVKSTIGAGDSMLAGFIDAVAADLDFEAALCHAVAFGTSSCLSEGTTPPHREDIARLEVGISVVRVR